MLVTHSRSLALFHRENTDLLGWSPTYIHSPQHSEEWVRCCSSVLHEPHILNSVRREKQQKKSSPHKNTSWENGKNPLYSVSAAYFSRCCKASKHNKCWSPVTQNDEHMMVQDVSIVCTVSSTTSISRSATFSARTAVVPFSHLYLPCLLKK